MILYNNAGQQQQATAPREPHNQESKQRMLHSALQPSWEDNEQDILSVLFSLWHFQL